jgi:hypothetical protein
LRALGSALQLRSRADSFGHGHVMTTRSRSIVPQFAIAALSILSAAFTGIAWLGQPLRMVHLLTIVGLSMTAGVAWAQAIQRVRPRSAERADDPTGS